MTTTITKGQIGREDFELWDGITGTYSRKNSTGGTETLNKLDWVGVDALVKYGSGTSRSGSTLNTAIAAIGSNKVRLYLSPGTWTLDANVTIPANITPVIPHGTIIDYATYTLTWNGPTDGIPDTYWCNYSSTGKLVLNSPVVIIPQWFHASGSDYATAFTNMMTTAAASSAPRRLRFPNIGGYSTSAEIDMAFGDFTLEVQDDVTSTNTTESNVFHVYGTAGTPISNVKLIGNKVTITGNGSNVVGYTYSAGDHYDCIQVEYAKNIEIAGFHCTDGLINCCRSIHSQNANIHDCTFSNSVYDNGCSITNNYDLTATPFSDTDVSTHANSIIQNCVAYGNQDIGFTLFDAHHSVIDNCIAYSNGTDQTTGLGWGGGFSIEDSSGTPDTYSYHSKITNCVAYDNIGRGIFITANSCELTSNHIYNSDAVTASDTANLTGNGILVTNATDVIINGKTVVDLSEKHGIHAFGNDTGVFVGLTIDGETEVKNSTLNNVNGQGIARLVIKGDVKIHDATEDGVAVTNATSTYNAGAGIVDISAEVYDNGIFGVDVNWPLDCFINDSKIYNNCTASGASNVQLNNLTNVFVKDNRITGTMTNGVLVASGVTNFHHSNNYITAGTNPINNQATNHGIGETTYIESIADDAFTSFQAPADNGVLLIVSDDGTAFSGAALITVTASTASIVSLGGGANFAVTTGALAGTTGSDGNLTVSVHTDEKIYIENRVGSGTGVSWKMLVQQGQK